MKFRVAIIGTSQSGKSTVGQMLNEMVGGGFFDTSDMLKEGFAKQLWETNTFPISGAPEGTPRELWEKIGEVQDTVMAEVMRYKTDKPEYRQQLMDYGIEQEKRDPLFTVAEPLRRACFVAGTRTLAQLHHMRKRVDWVVYINRPGYEPNSTDQLSPANASLTIDNDGTLLDLKSKVEAFVTLFGPGTFELEYRRQGTRFEVDDEPGIHTSEG